MKDRLEVLRPARQLEAAMLQEAEADDQPKWHRGPVSLKEQCGSRQSAQIRDNSSFL